MSDMKLRTELYKLKELAFKKHPKGGMQTARDCVCGHHQGGPAGSKYCQALKYVIDTLKDCGALLR